MAREISKAEAEQYSRDKQIVEAILAQDLYKYFNTGQALTNLQKLATRCAREMVYGQESTLLAAAEEEKNLRVWSKIGGKTTDSLVNFFGTPGSRAHELDATDVADMIRLYGCWVEHGGFSRVEFRGPGQDAWGSGGKKFTETAAMKDAYRAGAPGHKGQWKKTEVEAVWGDKKGRFANVGVARRFRGGGSEIEDHIKPFMRDSNTFSGMGGLPNNPGIGKRAAGDSNVLKIDRIFGLITGADISGTTTDTVFALETLGQDFLTAAYYMLPLATIVHNNHHALIEVALALSINGVLDYHIGFYSSLLPKAVRNVPAELAGVDGILLNAERDPRNRFFVVYYNLNGVAGGLLLSKEEALALKKFFGASTLLAKAPSFPVCPGKATILIKVFQGNLRVT